MVRELNPRHFAGLENLRSISPKLLYNDGLSVATPNPILDTKGLMDVVQPILNLGLSLTDIILLCEVGSGLNFTINYYKAIQKLSSLAKTHSNLQTSNHLTRSLTSEPRPGSGCESPKLIQTNFRDFPLK